MERALGWATLTAITSSNGTGGFTEGLTSGNSAYDTVIIQLDQTTTITAGAVTFEGTVDGTNWAALQAWEVTDPTVAGHTQISIPYTLVASTNKQFLLHIKNYQQTRLRVSTTMTGTGSITPYIVAQPLTNIVQGMGSLASTTSVTPAGGIMSVSGTMGAAGDLLAIGGHTGGILDSATGAAVSAAALNVGARAQNAEATAATNNQTVNFAADLVGKLIVSPFANKENYVKGTTSAMTGTTSTQVLALVSSQKLYVTAIHCTNSSTTVNTLVSIQDGSGGTVLDTLAAADNFGGEDRTGTSPLFWTTAGNGLYAADVTTGASVICSASGYSGT